MNVRVDINHLLSIWENDGLEDAVTAFHYCINGGDINDFWPLDRAKKKKKQSITKSSRIKKEKQIPEDIIFVDEIPDDIFDKLQNIDFDSIEKKSEL